MFQLKWKELLVMFLTFIFGTWIGGWLNDLLGLSPTGDFFSVLLYAFVPFVVFYIIWKNYTKKMTA